MEDGCKGGVYGRQREKTRSRYTTDEDEDGDVIRHRQPCIIKLPKGPLVPCGEGGAFESYYGYCPAKRSTEPLVFQRTKSGPSGSDQPRLLGRFPLPFRTRTAQPLLAARFWRRSSRPWWGSRQLGKASPPVRRDILPESSMLRYLRSPCTSPLLALLF